MKLLDIFKSEEEAKKWLAIKESLCVRDGDCLLYTGGLSKWGYGKCRIKKKNHGLHRIVKLIYEGEIPDGMVVMHSCDTPSCVNNDHLSIGTVLSNNRDIAAKRRAFWQKNYVEACVKSEKHSIKQVLRSIRKYIETGSVESASEAYGVHKGTLQAYIREALGKIENIPEVKETRIRIIKNRTKKEIPKREKPEKESKPSIMDMSHSKDAINMVINGYDIQAIAKYTGATRHNLKNLFDVAGYKPVRKVKYRLSEEEKSVAIARIESGERVASISRSMGYPYGVIYALKSTPNAISQPSGDLALTEYGGRG